MNTYNVEVRKCGNFVKMFEGITADTAAQAMDWVETQVMKLKPARVSINKSTGKMAVIGWHGFEFVARAI